MADAEGVNAEAEKKPTYAELVAFIEELIDVGCGWRYCGCQYHSQMCDDSKCIYKKARRIVKAGKEQ